MHNHLTHPLNEFSVAYIALTEWVPPLFTIVFGGLLASILVPRWQEKHARNQAREDRKLTLAEELSRNLTGYNLAWARLRTIAELEATRKEGLSKTEFERKKSYVQARSLKREELLNTMCSLEVYFSNDVRSLIDDYLQWDEEQSALSLKELSDRSEFDGRRIQILAAVHREVQQ